MCVIALPCRGIALFQSGWRAASLLSPGGRTSMKYPALIDGEAGAYGAVFPDLPGCVAMGCTVDEVVRNAEDAMRDWIASMEASGQRIPEPSPLATIAVPPGNTLTSISLAGVLQ